MKKQPRYIIFLSCFVLIPYSFPLFCISVFSPVFIGSHPGNFLKLPGKMTLRTEPEIKSDLLDVIVRIFQQILASPYLFQKDILLDRYILILIKYARKIIRIDSKLLCNIRHFYFVMEMAEYIILYFSHKRIFWSNLAERKTEFIKIL